jgi:hypothetical protein
MSPLCSTREAVQWTQRPAAPLTSEISEKISIKFSFGIKHYNMPTKVIFGSYRTNIKQNRILTIFSGASRWQQQLSQKGGKLPVCTVSHPRGTRILIYDAVDKYLKSHTLKVHMLIQASPQLGPILSQKNLVHIISVSSPTQHNPPVLSSVSQVAFPLCI